MSLDISDDDEEIQKLPIIDERTCRLLNNDEICPVINNEGLICFFDEGQFINVFSEIFRATPHVFKPYTKESKDAEMILFKSKDYTFIFDKLKETPLKLKTEYNSREYEFEILVHPIRRNCFVIDNETFSQEKIDILPIVKSDKHAVSVKCLIYRMGEKILKELDQIYDNKKTVYIR